MTEASQSSEILDFLDSTRELIGMAYAFAADSLMYTLMIVAQFHVTLIDLIWDIQNWLLKISLRILLAPVIYIKKLSDHNGQLLRLCNRYLSLNNKIFELVLKLLRYCKNELKRLAVALLIIFLVIVIRILEFIIWIISKITHLLNLVLEGYPIKRDTIGDIDGAPGDAASEDNVAA